MTTHLTTSPEEAAEVLRRGELVAFPTETVYGLGADAFQPAVVRQIFEAKERPSDNPLIVHLWNRDQIPQVAARIPPSARRLLERFVPGALTLILPKHEDVPAVVTAGLGTVGVRLPRHPVARSFLRACDTPVPAPSANRSGRPSPTSWKDVYDDLNGRIACILQGERTPEGVESTVVDCTSEPPIVLRPGAVTVEALREVLVDVEVATESEAEASGRSPGTRHRHYAPNARVSLVEDPSQADPSSDAAFIGLDAPAAPEAFGKVLVVPDLEAYAHDLFHFFRACDGADVSVIYAQTVSGEGLGLALNDRLRRAAAR